MWNYVAVAIVAVIAFSVLMCMLQLLLFMLGLLWWQIHEPSASRWYTWYDRQLCLWRHWFLSKFHRKGSHDG